MGNRVRRNEISFHGTICGFYYVLAIVLEAMGTWGPSRGSQAGGGNRLP